MKVLLFGIILLIFIIVPKADALMNDKMETLWFWDKETINVTLVQSVHTNDDRVAEVTEVVTSQEFFMIEDNLLHKDKPGVFSPYYLGWQGALDNSNATLKNLNFEFSAAGSGDVIISLTSQSSPDGYGGVAKPLFVNGKVSKVFITIYNIDKLSLAMLYSIVMHEMGHAIGIGHTTAPEDVMYQEKVNVPYPYVSPCMMQALQVVDEGKAIIDCKK